MRNGQYLDSTDSDQCQTASQAKSIDLSLLFPNAFKVYLDGKNIFLVTLHDGQRAAIYFDKHKGCYVIEREGKDPQILTDAKGQPIKIFADLVKVLEGLEMKMALKVHSKEIER